MQKWRSELQEINKISFLEEEPFTYFTGYHILEPLIRDREISDIKVISYDRVRVKRFGKREDSAVRFKYNQELKKFAEFIADKNQVSIL